MATLPQNSINRQEIACTVSDRPLSFSAQARNRAAFRKTLARTPNADLPHDEWVRIGLVVAATLGEAGRDDFFNFSMRSSKFNELATDTAYDRFMAHRAAVSS